MRWTVGWVILLLAVSGARAKEPSARRLVAKANEAFRAGDYDKALAGYREAELSVPESPEVAYNQALAHYKLGDYEAARNFFNRALATRDQGLEANVKYNLGNVAYSSALEKMSNFQEALDLLKQAIGHYRDGLELAPDDEDAKANIQMAQLLIKDLLDKIKKQQEQQKKQQDQNDKKNSDQKKKQKQDQKQDQSQSQDQKKQQKPSQGDQKQDQQDKQPKEANGQDQQQNQKENKPGAAGEQRQEAQRKMTREEANRLLQAVRDKERRRREEKARRLHASRAPVLKDW